MIQKILEIIIFLISIFFIIECMIFLWNKRTSIFKYGNFIALIYIIVLYNENIIVNLLDRTVQLFLSLEENDLLIKEWSNNIYKFCEECKYILYIFIIFEIISVLINRITNIIQKYKQKKEYELYVLRNEDDNNNKLYKNMYNYFSNESDNTPILITGAWGAGKTKTVNEFFEKYYKYEKQKVYKISCFGTTTRENLTSRIQDVCEKEDDRSIIKLLNIIEIIPIVGEFLKKLLSPKYDLNSIDANSIFIFDNFERIELCIDKYKDNLLEDVENKISVQEKYNIVTGVIDELIEKYNMKVIIIADEGKMLKGYVYENFICKLGCKKFEIDSKRVNFKELWDDIINKDFVVQNKYKSEFEEIFYKINNLSDEIWMITKCKNIRIFHKSIYEYIEFMKYLLNNEYEFDERKNEKIGIYISILIKSFPDYKNHMKGISNGESISKFFWKKYCSNELNLINEWLYQVFSDIDCIWYVNELCEEENLYWSNVENNHYNLIKYLKKIKLELQQREWEELTIFNYIEITNNTNKKIFWEDLVLLLKMENEKDYNIIIKLIKDNRVIFNSRKLLNEEEITLCNIGIDVTFVFKEIYDKQVKNIFAANKTLLDELFQKVKIDGNYEIREIKIRELYNELKNIYLEK